MDLGEHTSQVRKLIPPPLLSLSCSLFPSLSVSLSLPPPVSLSLFLSRVHSPQRFLSPFLSRPLSPTFFPLTNSPSNSSLPLPFSHTRRRRRLCVRQVREQALAAVGDVCVLRGGGAQRRSCMELLEPGLRQEPAHHKLNSCAWKCWAPAVMAEESHPKRCNPRSNEIREG